MKTVGIVTLIVMVALALAEAAMAQTSNQRRNGVTVVRGDFSSVICADNVRVRSQDLQSVLFDTRPYEGVKTFQGWGTNKQTRVLNGQRLTFVKVQFSDRDGRSQDIGWVAESYVKLRAQCPQAARAQQASFNLNQGSDPLANITGLNDPKCCFFPLKHNPNMSYTTGERKFGARRSGGRRVHAAADLYGNLYEGIRAVAPGKVAYTPIFFYLGTYEFAIKHKGGFVVRYGEISFKRQYQLRNIVGGAQVRTGQVIGHMGQVMERGRAVRPPMLHFELYSGAKNGQALTQRNRRGYQRRADLLNPTSHLQRWERATL